MKKLPIWLKRGIVGFIIGLVITFIFAAVNYFIASEIDWYTAPFGFLNYIFCAGFDVSCRIIYVAVLNWLLIPVIFLSIFAMYGLVLQKIKSKITDNQIM